MFVLPQYFRSVTGVDALGTGVRTLPLLIGMIVGLQSGMRLAKRIGFARSATIGFVTLAAGLVIGTTTGVHTGFALIGAWTALAGFGTGMGLIGAQSAALNTLEKARAGAGTAVMQAMRQVGSVTGIAALGAVLNGVYRSGVHTAGLPSSATTSARDSVASGVTVGQQLHAPSVVQSAQNAFATGMDAVLWTSTVVCLAAAILVFLFLPNTGRVGRVTNDAGQSEGAVVEPEPQPTA